MRACIAIVGVGTLASAASADLFQIKIENLSNNVLTPTAFMTSNSNFDVFDQGAAASAEVELMAEGGDLSGYDSLVAGAGADVLGYEKTMGGPIMPGESRTINIEADFDHPYLTFASMLAITNDAFIGTAYGDGELDLFHNGQPLFADFTVSWLDVWDAGTEVNDELAENVPGMFGGMGSVDENGVITQPHDGILGVGDVPLDVDWYGFDVARITITPAPGTAALLGIGAIAMIRRRR
jgi:hypothetical protein